MFKRKKFMALCATTLAGISALGSFAPMAASADVAKNGDTVVTYEGAPKPAEWGLSVPGTISLTKDGKYQGYPVKYEAGKVSIVTASGTDFEDNTKDYNFKVSGISKYLTDDNKNMILHCISPESASPWLYAAVADQGSPEPDELPSNLNPNKDIISNMIFSSKMTGNKDKPLTRYISFASNPSVKDENYSNTISWTATEQ